MLSDYSFLYSPSLQATHVYFKTLYSAWVYGDMERNATTRAPYSMIGMMPVKAIFLWPAGRANGEPGLQFCSTSYTLDKPRFHCLLHLVFQLALHSHWGNIPPQPRIIKGRFFHLSQPIHLRCACQLCIAAALAVATLVQKGQSSARQLVIS